jgi:hypothetical protein
MPIRLAGRLAGRSARDVTVVDLSLSGCLVQCETLLDHGAILDLRVELAPEPLTAKVEVTEASLDGAASAESPRYLAGLRFLALPVKEEARLMRFLDDERRRRSADAASH